MRNAVPAMRSILVNCCIFLIFFFALFLICCALGLGLEKLWSLGHCCWKLREATEIVRTWLLFMLISQQEYIAYFSLCS